MNDTRRDVPGVSGPKRKRSAVDYSRAYVSAVGELDTESLPQDSKGNGNGSVGKPLSSPPLKCTFEAPHIPPGKGTVVRRRRVGDCITSVDRFDAQRSCMSGQTQDPFPELEVVVAEAAESSVVDQRKVEDFKTFLTYVLGSEIRLVMMGYVLSQRTNSKTDYSRLRADLVLARLDKLIDDEVARMYISTHNNQGSIIKHMRDTFGPLVHVKPNQSSRSKPFFQLSVHAEKYVLAAQYAYQWLARHELESMGTVFSPKQDQILPGPVCDVLFLQAIADGCQDSQAIKNYFRSGVTGFKWYNLRQELPDTANLGHSVARRIDKYKTLGHITDEEGLKLTAKGKSLVGFIRTLYGLFIADETAAKTVAKEMKSYKKDGQNPHAVLIPRYFEGNRSGDCTFIDSLKVIYEQIPETGEGLNAKEIYERLAAKADSFSKPKVEEGILLLSMKGYLISHQIVKEVRRGAGKHNGTLHTLNSFRYIINPDKPFLR